jgi:NAD(P)-dependent dehydrogenase (short-subunit alcohol dehydrogenase family)
VIRRALVTGGRGGIGAAIAASLPDTEVVSVDLADGFDVSDPAAWRTLGGEFDAAFLNAGVTTGEQMLPELTDEQYRRALGANVDGVVLGTRELAARLMPNGG